MTVRRITDAHGGDWRVTYIQPAITRRRDDRYRVAQGCFCFTSRDGRCVCAPRKLFAGDWRRVSTRELRHLLADRLAASSDV